MPAPRTIKDFKKASATSTSNNPILQQKQMIQNQKNNGMGQMNTRNDTYNHMPQEETITKHISLEESMPNQQSNNAAHMTIGGVSSSKQSNYDNWGGSKKQEDYTQHSSYDNYNQQSFPKPNFVKDTTNYEEVAKQMVKSQIQETKQNGVNMNMQNQSQNQQQGQYSQVPFYQQNKPQPTKSNIATRVAEAEQEIDKLVGNTEMFLENIIKLKIDIINSKNADELANTMKNAYEVLENIPQGFIDSETCRKIRICFNHLEKTKKYLLDIETGLFKLSSISDIKELEKAYMEVPANASMDSIYEVRTFELTLLSKLPEIKEEMMKERVLSAYQQ